MEKAEFPPPQISESTSIDLHFSANLTSSLMEGILILIPASVFSLLPYHTLDVGSGKLPHCPFVTE